MRRSTLNFMRLRHVILFGPVVALLLQSVPASAAEALPPGQKQERHVRWFYPSQLSYGTWETGTADIGSRPAAGAVFTLSFFGPHAGRALFDDCSPEYRH